MRTEQQLKHNIVVMLCHLDHRRKAQRLDHPKLTAKHGGPGSSSVGLACLSYSTSAGMLGAAMLLVHGSSRPLMNGRSGDGGSSWNTPKEAACKEECRQIVTRSKCNLESNNAGYCMHHDVKLNGLQV